MLSLADANISKGFYSKEMRHYAPAKSLSDEYLARRFGRNSVTKKHIEYVVTEDKGLLFQLSLIGSNDFEFDSKDQLSPTYTIVAAQGKLCLGGMHVSSDMSATKLVSMCAEEGVSNQLIFASVKSDDTIMVLHRPSFLKGYASVEHKLSLYAAACRLVNEQKAIAVTIIAKSDLVILREAAAKSEVMLELTEDAPHVFSSALSGTKSVMCVIKAHAAT